MIASRWQLPESPLRASVVAAKATGLIALVGTAWALRAPLHLTLAYPLVTNAVFFLAMSLALGFVHDAHPFGSFGLANQITTIRLMLVALVAGLVVEEPSPNAAVLAVSASAIATALDGVDGWLARRHGMSSAFGARFDMEIDALLILSLSALAFRGGKAGAWVLASGLLRYVFIAAGWAFPWMAAPLPPSVRRKAVCVVQVSALIVVVAPFVVPPMSTMIAGAALLALLYSFLADTMWLGRRAT